LTALAGSAGSTSATVVVEPRPTVDVDGYVEWTDAVRATLRRRAPGLRNAGTGSDVHGSDDSGSSAASAAGPSTTRPRVVVVPDPPRIACDERGCGGGACNRELGACRCPLSLDGARCETFVPARCDEDPASPRELVGVEYKSRCAGECDLTAAKCRCGRGVAHARGDLRIFLRNAHPDWKPPDDVAANGTAYLGPYAPEDAPMSKFPDRPMQGCYYEGIAAHRTWHDKLDWDRAAGAPANDFWRPRDDPGPRVDWCAWEPGHPGVDPAVRCRCFDGYVGGGCETIVKQFCLNDCAGAGRCEHGGCKCDEGFFGADCSQRDGGGLVPTGAGYGYRAGGSDDPSRAGFVPDGGARRRHHLHAASAGLFDGGAAGGGATGGGAAGGGAAGGDASATRRTHARRPLIYVYDFLPKFTTAQLQHRQDVRKCVTRFAEEGNATRFEDNLYGAEVALHELLLDSPHRTDNPEIADFFFVPMYHFCFVSRLQQPTPGHSQQLFARTRGAGCDQRGSHVDAVFQHLFQPTLDHLRRDYPWWNRTNGADHIVPFLHDEGACYAPREFGDATLLVHWGRRDADAESCTGYTAHDWGDRTRDETHASCVVKRAAMLAGHPRGKGVCYRRGKDVVIPPWRTPRQFLESPLLAASARGAEEARRTASPTFEEALADVSSGVDDVEAHVADVEAHAARAMHRASVDAAVRYARTQPRDGPFFLFRGSIRQHNPAHSRGTRQEAFRFYGPGAAKSSPDVIVDEGAETYRRELATATFCGVFQGDGWSARLEDAVLNGCVPVVVMDDVDVAWEGYLDVDAIAVRHPRREIHSLVETLRAIPPERIAKMRVAGARVWHRFAWLGYFAAERERERAGLVRLDDKFRDAETLGKIAGVHGADAFETLLQVLRHRLVERELAGSASE